VIYAKVGHPKIAYLPKMPKLAFPVNTDLLRRFTVPQVAQDLRLASADAAWSGKSNIIRGAIY